VASDSVNACQALMPALRWGDSRWMPDMTGVASLEALNRILLSREAAKSKGSSTG